MKWLKYTRTNGICNMAEKYKKINKKGKIHILLEIDKKLCWIHPMNTFT